MSILIETEEQKDYRKMFHDFAYGEVYPRAAEADEKEEFPFELFDKMAEAGYTGMMTPVEYGGQGGGIWELAAAAEEMAYYDSASALILVCQSLIPSGMLMAFGTKEQKEKYLPMLAQGIVNGKREISAMAMTEPGAGSDLRGIKTKAVLEGDHYVINGSKCFISNGAVATVVFLFAQTENGLSTFIVESSFLGFKTGEVEKKMGLRSSLASHLYFDDLIVPKENLLGKEGDGFKIAQSILDEDRTINAICCCGMSQRAIDESVKYSKERIQFSKRISEFQNTKFQFAKMQTRADAGKMLAYRAVQALADKDPKASLYVSEAKYYCSDVCNDIARRAVQIMGGYGYTRDYPVEKIMRDAKIFEIMTGTSEIMKLGISKAMGVR